MSRSFRIVTLAALAALATAGSLLAIGQGRVLGKVVDPSGEPLAGVKITVTTPEISSFKVEATSDKRGSFLILLVDATRRYVFHLDLAGYQPLEMPVKPEIEGTLRQEFTLLPVGKSGSVTVGGSGAPEGQAPGAPASDPAIELFNAGVDAFQAGDAAAAEAKFRDAARANPKLAQAHLALAGLLLERQDHAGAAAEAEAVLALEPTNVRALSLRYDAYKALGDKAKTAEARAALLAIEKGSDAAARVYNEGAEAARVGDMATAKEKFEQAAGLDPKLIAPQIGLAVVAMAQKRYQDAAAAADLAVSLEPTNAKALKLRFDAYRALGDEAKAKEALAALLASDPASASGGLLEQGTKMFNGGDVAGARTVFETILDADPGNAKAHYLLALCLVSASDADAKKQAREHLERFLQLAPNDPQAGTAREMLKYLQ